MIKTGKFIGTALARMERGKAFSIILDRLQHELREAYGAENARKVLQAIMDTMEEDGRLSAAWMAHPCRRARQRQDRCACGQP